MIDVVVPIYNSLHHVRSCLKSIVANVTGDVHLYVVDDGSQSFVSDQVRVLLAREAPGWSTLIKNEKNMGYLRSANRGGMAGHGDYIVFVNSDTVVPPGFLEKVEQGLSSAKIGVLSAVSNWANWSRVCWAIPSGHNVYSINEALSASGAGIIDINNASGFFFATPRWLFEEVGGFDEIYGAGYWEEADYCMKVLSRELRVVIDSSLFVYHHGWGTFKEEGRNENMNRNKAVFMSRWGDMYERLICAFRECHPIPYMSHDVLAKKHSHPPILDIAPNEPPKMSDAIRYRLLPATAAEYIEAFKRGDMSLSPRKQIGDRWLSRRPKIIYILPAIGLYGGIISVLQIVNQLILNGFDANVATYGKVDDEVYKLFPCFFNALRFDSQAELAAYLPDCELIVATSWDSVYPALAAAQQRPHVSLAYFVQDFEPDFFPEDEIETRRQAELTYKLIDQKIVKTRWLKKKVCAYGGSVHRIPLGLNLDYFYNQGLERGRQVIALGRPSSHRRNFPMVIEVFSELLRRDPKVKVALYGYGYNSKNLPFELKDYGRLSQFTDVAKAMNESSVLLDCSTFQGFGRPGLEAMACGTFPVLTREGGITQYAKHGYNCLLIDPQSRDDIVDKIIRALDDTPLRGNIVSNGLNTATEYSLEMEGIRTAKLFTLILSGANIPGLEPSALDKLNMSLEFS